MSRAYLVVPASVSLIGMSSPAFAASEFTAATVFLDAAVPIKLMMLMLCASMVAAVVVTVRKLLSPNISGGSAYLAALRFAGPLLGLLGAGLNALFGFLAIAGLGRPVPLEVLAPGLAEATLVLVLGLLAGVVAVACNWAVDARIDRAVLNA
jgi:hypothetical protein